MIKLRYVTLAFATATIITLTACNNLPPSPSASQVTTHANSSNRVKININSAILSELDKLEAKLGIPALSNKIQANRPYGSPEDLVSKKVISSEQLEQIKDLVTVQAVILTGEAKDVDYMTKLGLMQGHLLVAQELLNQNLAKQAEPHIGHPVEEIYVDVEEELNQRKVKEFKSTLISLQNLLKSKPDNPKVKADLAASIEAVHQAIGALPETQRSKPGFILQVISQLLDAANSEYEAAIANDKIAAAVEYQDSRGFVLYAKELYQQIGQTVATENPPAHAAIESSFTELITAWPSVTPPIKPTKTSVQVDQLISTIEQNSQQIIIKSQS